MVAVGGKCASVLGGGATNEGAANNAELAVLRQDLALAEAKCTSIFENIKDLIGKMSEALKRQPNINKTVKEGLPKLQGHLELLEHVQIAALKARRNVAEKVKAAVTRAPVTPQTAKSAKRPSSVSPNDSPKRRVSKKKKKEEKKSEEMETASTDPGEEGWEKVEKKKAKKKKKKKKKNEKKTEESKKRTSPKTKVEVKKRAMTEAIVLKPSDGKTYAEILSGIKGRVNPSDHAAEIKSIRRTRTGDVLLELKTVGENNNSLADALKSAVGETASLSSLIPRVKLEIRDIDCCATTEEVSAAVKAKTSQQPFGVRLTRPNRAEQIMAIVTVTETEARKLLDSPRIRIGWVNCRVRRRQVVERCYRCLGYGHLSKTCRGPDRSTSCYRCGGQQHKAAECTAEARCFICAGAGGSGGAIKQYAGSGAFEAFRKALKGARQNG